MKRILLDVRPLILKLLSGIIVVLILGLAFNSKFETKTIDVGDVLYLNEDGGSEGDFVIQSLISQDDLKGMVNFKEAQALEDAKDLVNSGSVCAVLYFPCDFSEKYTIEVYSKSYADTNGLVIKSLMDSFSNQFNAIKIAVQMNTNQGIEVLSTDDVIEKCSIVNNESTTAMQYYAIAMVIMLILYGTEYGSIKIAEDFTGPLGERLKLSPINPFCQYIGKIVGLSFMVVLEAIFLILFTKIVYRVNWGNNYFWLLIIVISTSFLATAIGAMFTIITRNYAIADVLCMTVIFGCTFLSGGFIAADFGWFKYITPNYYAKNAINTLIYNGDMHIVYTNVCRLWIVIAVVTLVSVIFGRRTRQ